MAVHATEMRSIMGGRRGAGREASSSPNNRFGDRRPDRGDRMWTRLRWPRRRRAIISEMAQEMMIAMRVVLELLELALALALALVLVMVVVAVLLVIGSHEIGAIEDGGGESREKATASHTGPVMPIATPGETPVRVCRNGGALFIWIWSEGVKVRVQMSARVACVCGCVCVCVC